MKIVDCNASPLIVYIQTGQLKVLKKLFNTIHITSEVAKEIESGEMNSTAISTIIKLKLQKKIIQTHKRFKETSPRINKI